jgi:hypothetical protein
MGSRTPLLLFVRRASKSASPPAHTNLRFRTEKSAKQLLECGLDDSEAINDPKEIVFDRIGSGEGLSPLCIQARTVLPMVLGMTATSTTCN